MSISVLYVRRDSVYKQLGVDCWDADRDATKWPGGNSLVAHPPCRAWGQLSHFAKPREGEKDLALRAVEQIRKWGGILEHPWTSRLWAAMNLPRPGTYDNWGGYTIMINQHWFGHKAEKKTFLYIVGCPQKDLPPVPLKFDAIEYTVGSRIKKYSGRRQKKEITKREREETPIELAKFLIKIAEKANELIPTQSIH